MEPERLHPTCRRTEGSGSQLAGTFALTKPMLLRTSFLECHTAFPVHLASDNSCYSPFTVMFPVTCRKQSHQLLLFGHFQDVSPKLSSELDTAVSQHGWPSLCAVEDSTLLSTVTEHGAGMAAHPPIRCTPKDKGTSRTALAQSVRPVAPAGDSLGNSDRPYKVI